MNFDIWGPSHGLFWKPYKFSTIAPSSPGLGWQVELKCEYLWLTGLPINGPFGVHEHAWFPNFSLVPSGPFGTFFGTPPLPFGMTGVPSYLPIDVADPAYTTWMASSPGAVDWRNDGDQWEEIWCENDPSASNFTDGHIVLKMWPGIDLTSLPAVEFDFLWPASPTLFPVRGGIPSLIPGSAMAMHGF